MRSTSFAILITIFLVTSAYSQGAAGKDDAALSPAVVRIKAMQYQVEKQQIEIDALKFRLARLQQAFQELAETVADQSSDADDDDLTDDSDVASLVVNSRAKGSKRSARHAARTKIAVWSNKGQSSQQCRTVH